MKVKRTTKRGGVLVELAPQETRMPGCAPAPVFNLKKILVPVDFSECSDKALEYAAALAGEFAAKITLLHVVQPYPGVPDFYNLPVESLPDTKEDLEALRKTVGDAVDCQTSVRFGKPATEIIDAASDLDVDLIILSTHGHTGVTRAILGSTTEQVVRRAGCPVLVVRPKEHDFIPCTEAKCCNTKT